MPTKAEVETYIIETAATHDNFQSPSPDLATAPVLEQMIEAGYNLLEHYEATDDTAVDDAVVGALVDAAMALSQLDPGALSAEARERATELMAALEDLVNGITAAVERNIAAGR